VRKSGRGLVPAHAAERLPERAAIWAKKLGVAGAGGAESATSGAAGGAAIPRATCASTGGFIQAAMRLVDYVVAHELVTLAHRNHTAGFWAALGRVMPDYEARRERLCQVGRRL